MNYMILVYGHLGSVLPAFFIGSYLLFNAKGTTRHRYLGKLYMLLMVATAIITLLMPAHVGPTLLNHFGWIHLLSILVLYSVTMALLSIQRGDIVAHRQHMIGLYIGGLLVAGSFTLLPGRLLHEWLLA